MYTRFLRSAGVMAVSVTPEAGRGEVAVSRVELDAQLHKHIRLSPPVGQRQNPALIVSLR
ncbi:MAG TPA: hypothetical protein VFH40_14930 [Gemmatimonadales bacterium]|jgi:hypothetical protein|nr:hypothetical protein [Gemmatimonadales bacterium]